MSRYFQQLIIWFAFIFLTGCNSMAMYQSISSAQVERAGMMEKVLELPDGGRLHYWDRGEGEPLILIHGLGGDAMMNWKEQMLSFDSHYRVIAPDLLWFGDSSSGAQKNLLTQAEALFALMDHLKIEKTHVVGHSYGGFVAYKMMDSNIQRLKSMTLVSSPGPILQDSELYELLERFGVEKLENLFVPEKPADLRVLNQGIFYKPIPAPGFVYRDIHSTFIEPHKYAQRYLVESLPHERASFDLTKNHDGLPVFLIWGANDKIFPVHTGINLSRYLRAPIAILDNGAHAIPAENPEVLSQLIEAFLAR